METQTPHRHRGTARPDIFDFVGRCPVLHEIGTRIWEETAKGAGVEATEATPVGAGLEEVRSR